VITGLGSLPSGVQTSGVATQYVSFSHRHMTTGSALNSNLEGQT